MGKAAASISRREFLRKGIAAGAVYAMPLVLPSSVFGENAPSNRITIGIIGTGSQGILNLRGFINKPLAEIVAVCDVDLSHREQARRRAKLPEGSSYNDFRELLARDDIDAVVVSTPDHWHALISITAAKAGKDVYCEKPLAYNVAEGRALCDTVKRYGRVLQTGSHQRSDKNFRLACELVRNGRIGKLRTIKVEIPENRNPNPLTWKVESPPAGLDYNLWVGPAPYRPYIEQGCHYNWHFLYGFGSGQLTNWGAHMLDIAQWGNDADMTGPVEVSGTAEFPKEGLFETPLRYDLEYTYANGVRLLCSTGKPDGPETHVRFEGDRGWIFVSRNRFFSEPQSLIQSKISPNEIHLYRSSDHQQNFLDCVRQRTQPVADAETGHRSATVCHIGGIAVMLGRKLRWDTVKECFISDDQANRMLSRPMRPPWHL
ncbi:MAG: Gfo/Idh/MocA family oxidoreductase [Sedimentisphaerales bacterium]|nr:Gfo/Idh/MocA family oxidoreductase [Sedimentisphaerales bacterium]